MGRCPPGGEHIWALFLTLSNRREQMVVGEKVISRPISYRDLLDHMAVFKADIPVWERQAIFDLDQIVCAILNRPESETSKSIPANDTGALRSSFRALSVKG